MHSEEERDGHLDGEVDDHAVRQEVEEGREPVDCAPVGKKAVHDVSDIELKYLVRTDDALVRFKGFRPVI